ncbi:hypothetical protein F5878DRAFT_666622 [Lentinula raphanica]|uniref:Uncharacterized protein n=1 Tax=Lentinula raphanica TaxID=153919 RepID=A0AA38NXD0_9AGAR|nr:hypothetical protein F5878DRAFT_666622 [Lentinula raphanica]
MRSLLAMTIVHQQSYPDGENAIGDLLSPSQLINAISALLNLTSDFGEYRYNDCSAFLLRTNCRRPNLRTASVVAVLQVFQNTLFSASIYAASPNVVPPSRMALHNR